jgi:uncharacterized SAM-dependent methyltransferase
VKPSPVQVLVDESQSPEAIQGDLLRSLRTRKIEHKFHYESYKQSRKWLALHQAYAPSRTDADCVAIYERAFESVAGRIGSRRAWLAGLGCGGGQKDGRLLDLLEGAGIQTHYTPCDVSLALVLTARKAALKRIPAARCQPLVCDLSGADLPAILDRSLAPQGVITFFGMIPNFEPSAILPRLSAALEAGDWLLFSANLAPGRDYAAGVARVLGGYDNALTCDWLGTFFSDLGVENGDGQIEFGIEEGEAGLLRIVANYRFARARAVSVEGEEFVFQAGDTVRLFFSYRHTPETVVRCLTAHGLAVEEQWIANSEEEGVFLCRKAKL